MILDYSFAVQLNFRNFRNFRNQYSQCFACFANDLSQVLEIRFLQGFANTYFRSFTFVSQVSQVFANTIFARFRNSQFRKNSKKKVSFQKFRKVFATGSLLILVSSRRGPSILTETGGYKGLSGGRSQTALFYG